MTPRLALTAALLAAACAARAVGSPCEYSYPEEAPLTPAEIARGDIPLIQEGLSGRECQLLHDLETPIERMAEAAGLKGFARLGRFLPKQDQFNAYATDSGIIVVNNFFVTRLVDKPAAARWVMAHEIGHLVQVKKGLKAADDRLRADPAISAEKKLEASRVYESQADRIGGELLALAGYPIDGAEQVAEALGRDDFRLRSDHSHPAQGLRWLEALKQQEALAAARHDEALAVVRRRTRKLMSTPVFDRVPGTSPDEDKSTPMEWAATAPAAAAYRNRKPYEPANRLAQFDSQGRLPTEKNWQVSRKEPPSSAAPEDLRGDPGLAGLSLSDRLALRARAKGPQSSYASAVWTGGWDWLWSGDWLAKEPAKAVKP